MRPLRRFGRIGAGIAARDCRRERLPETSGGIRPRAFGRGVAEVFRRAAAREIFAGEMLLRVSKPNRKPAPAAPLSGASRPTMVGAPPPRPLLR